MSKIDKHFNMKTGIVKLRKYNQWQRRLQTYVEHTRSFRLSVSFLIKGGNIDNVYLLNYVTS